MRVVRLLVGAGCVMLLAGCGTQACAVINPNCLRGSILIHPLDVRFLKGDTVILSAIGDAGRQNVNWVIDGAGRFVVNGALTDHLTNQSDVTVKLVSAGPMNVYATALDGDHKDTRTYIADDTSAITAVALVKNPSDQLSLPPNIGGVVACFLLDAAGNEHAARPTSWVSTDPSVATITQYEDSRGCSAALHSLKAGQTKIVANFLGLSDTLYVTVTP